MASYSRWRDAQRPRAEWRIRIAADAESVDAEWRLLEESGAATAFQSYAWARTLMDVAGRAKAVEPLFVLVSNAATGAPQMLLPLCRRQEGALTAIEFLDLGASDYNAPLIAADFRPSSGEFATLWTAIRAALPPADMLRIDKSPAMLAGAPNPLASLSFMHRLTLAAWTLPLPATRRDYERTAIVPRVAKELRRKRRRLEELGALRLRQAQDAGEAAAMLRQLADYRRERYRALQRHDILADPDFHAFYDALLRRRDGLAEIHALEVGRESVAILLGLRRAGAFHFLLSGFRDGEWASKSAGSVAIDMMLSRAIADGLTTFDFTIGNAAYKRRFGAAQQDLYGGAQALSFRALPKVAQHRVKGSLRTLLTSPAMQTPLAPH